MERVLALQGLSELALSEEAPGGSGQSNGCSSASTGTGDSGCSINCRDTEELDW